MSKKKCLGYIALLTCIVGFSCQGVKEKKTLEYDNKPNYHYYKSITREIERRILGEYAKKEGTSIKVSS